jgi:hypothetical protein
MGIGLADTMAHWVASSGGLQELIDQSQVWKS